MAIIYILLGGIIGWILHAVLSFKKFGGRLNEAEKKVWAMTPKNERLQKRIEILHKLIPAMKDQEQWSNERALEMDQNEFPDQYMEEVPMVKDLDEDQKNILKHILDYRKKTGKQNPSYDEMLKMNEDELKSWALYRSQKENRKELLEEMTFHEEKTGSLKKTLRKEITDGEQTVLNVFDKDKSSDTVNFLEKLTEITAEDDSEEKDFVLDAIFAKIVSDSVGFSSDKK